MMPSTLERTPVRFTMIDGLRGIAAMGVVCCHLLVHGRFAEQFRRCTPDFLFQIVNNGFLGVPVFFVLSGFVIAYSQRGVRVTGRFLGNFALRRSLRLDPPYWTTIAFMLTLRMLSSRHDPSVDPFPGWGDVAAHIFYLQVLLHLPQINGVFWTLCYEVQFYLVLTLLVWLCQSLPLADRPLLGFRHGSRLVVFVPMIVLSIAAHLNWIYSPTGLFIDRWYSFFFGVLIWWILDGSISARWFWVYLGIVALAALGDARGGNFGIVLTTSMTSIAGAAIYAAGVMGRLTSLLRGPVVQFLGRISYSLYLIHTSIGGWVESFGLRHSRGSAAAAFFWMGLAIIASIVAAYSMYRVVERPGVQLGKRFKYHASHASAQDTIRINQEKALV